MFEANALRIYWIPRLLYECNLTDLVSFTSSY